jgi:ABC-2 type transport system ATP-binding protein
VLATGSPDAIRSLRAVTPAGTVRYTVATDDVMAIFRRVRTVAAVRDATIFGRDIHVVVDTATSAEDLARDLEVDPQRVRPISPSLEDAFVALTREREA